MKQVQNIENYLSLEATVKSGNKWVSGSQDENLLFSNHERGIAVTDNVHLLQDLKSVKLSGSI
jgi:hypothetical protein